MLSENPKAVKIALQVQALQLEAQVFVNENQYAEALLKLDEAIELQADEPELWNERGIVLTNLGQYEDAIAAFNAAIRLDPQDAAAHNNLGNAYSAQQNDADALLAFQAALRLNPPDAASIHNNLGEIYLRQAQFQQAEQVFNQAIEMGGDRYNRRFGLGLAQALQGNSGLAQENWQHSLQLCTGETPDEKLYRPLIQLLVQSQSGAIATLQNAIQQAQAAKGLLQDVLANAQRLARCPHPPDGIEQVISLLGVTH